MKRVLSRLAVSVAGLLTALALASADTDMDTNTDTDGEYSNMWVVNVRGGEEVAQRVARELGYSYHGQADAFDDHYIFKRSDHLEVNKRGSHQLTRSLQDMDEVVWAEQQAYLKRSKRGIIPSPRENVPKARMSQAELLAMLQGMKTGGSKFGSGGSRPPYSFYSASPFSSGSSSPFSSSSFSSPTYGSSSGSGKPYKVTYYSSQDDDSGSQGDTGKLGSFSTKPKDYITAYKGYSGVTKHVECLSSKKSAYDGMFNDPLWPKQWYSQDYRTQNMPVMDLNVVPVYKMGITGKDIKVAVVDDGVQHGHLDLAGNFMESWSYDMNNDRPGSNPDASTGSPNSHGSKCAGEIAMVANNNKCGVGIAYNCKIAGVKTLGRRVVEYMESRGLLWKLDLFDMYSCSWGPADDGQTMEKAGRLTSMALEKGATQGRNNKGALYVFAGGNGKHQGDNCAADGLVNNPNTIAIASVSQRGKTAYYSERCTAIMAGTYSGGNGYDEAVATIDLNGGCTTTFSGTSAATPIASGIFALALQANPQLTRRDILHLVTMSAEVAPLADNGDIWYKNGAGFWVSNDFGFGLLNAENMVTLAKSWTTVPKKNTCVVSIKLDDPQYFTVGEVASIAFKTVACQDTADDAVYYLEQIEVASTVEYPYRGAISITLKSPAGTTSNLLEPRPKDSNRGGLNEWSIKSVHNWGEDPKGTWQIQVKANALEGVRQSSGYVNEFTLTFHGMATKAAHFNQLPRKYSGFRLSNGKTSEV